MDLMVIIMGIVLVLVETNGVYWYAMDSIGGLLNPIGKIPKTHYEIKFCNVLLEKANGLEWYFNGNHWNFCNDLYWASIVFFIFSIERLSRF